MAKLLPIAQKHLEMDLKTFPKVKGRGFHPHSRTVVLVHN
jgi:hypothetical protein